MNYLVDFKEFYLRTVLPNTISYKTYFGINNFDQKINILIDNYKKSYNSNPFEVVDVENSIVVLEKNLKKDDTLFSDYSKSNGNDVPKYILLTHFTKFLRYYNSPVLFSTFQDFVNLVHKDINNIGRSKDFISNFRETRKNFAGHSKIVNQDLLFGNVRDKYWTINLGAEKEIQYHMHLSQTSIRYGLGFNLQGSQNNNDPIKNVRPFKESFYSFRKMIDYNLQDYKFLEDNEEKLKNLNYGEFILYGYEIPVAKDSNNYIVQGLDYLKILYDLRNKQFKAYKIIFENSKLPPEHLMKINIMNDFIKFLNFKKQIILQGPPGTGKTREAKLIAKEMLGLNPTDDLKGNEQFKIIQFHPSYTYEDFVRGIVAESKGDKIEYKNVNKILGEFADAALKNYLDSKKIPEQVSKENWVNTHYIKFKESIQKEIETDNEVLIKEETKPKITFVEDNSLRVNRYSNENDSVLVKDSDIINGYVGLYLSEMTSKIRDNELLSKSARSGMYYLYKNLVEKFKKYLDENNLQYSVTNETKKIDKKPYILIIDEINRANLSSVLGELIYALEYRGEEVESMYEVDGSQKLVLPPNLYIIGTMNTADRSVGHIDYAIRRRFAFVDVLPEKLKDTEDIFFNTLGFVEVAKLFIKVGEDEVINFENAEDSDFLSNDFSSKDVALGHSYFIADRKKISEEEKENYFKMKMKYEVIPILNEYLRDGVFNESAIAKIKDIEQRFA